MSAVGARAQLEPIDACRQRPKDRMWTPLEMEQVLSS
jgi:hypothetical protein